VVYIIYIFEFPERYTLSISMREKNIILNEKMRQTFLEQRVV